VAHIDGDEGMGFLAAHRSMAEAIALEHFPTKWNQF